MNNMAAIGRSVSVRGMIVLLALACAIGAGISFGAEGSSSDARQYYVDAEEGSDANKGTSPSAAWESLEKVSGKSFRPGDRILLKSGCTFTGQLAPDGSGTSGQPIIVDSYGSGPDPVLRGEGKVKSTILLDNQHHWEIRNLVVMNEGEERKLRRAVQVKADGGEAVPHVYLEDLTITNVNGIYAGEGHLWNGGIICTVRGEGTSFEDLRITGCTFETRSIARYPVVVGRPDASEAPGEVVYHGNRLDHSGRAHIVIPPAEWPRARVYYFCPECREVFGLKKDAAPVCPDCGRVGVEDIFSEIASRLQRSWEFYEATRVEEGRWLFANSPGGKKYHADEADARTSPTYPLAYYGELRAMGFVPPWLDRDDENMREKEDKILKEWVNELVEIGVQREEDWNIRNRVFMNKSKWPEPRTGESFRKALRQYGEEPDLSTRKKAQAYFDSLPWQKNPYGACNFIGKALEQHCRRRLARGKDRKDEVYYYVKGLINSRFQADKGYWGGQKAGHVNRTSGNMKILTTYAKEDWEIPNPWQVIDFHLSGATEEAGFEGSGCSSFNQMHTLATIRRKYPEMSDYRSKEIDRYTARTFKTFLSNWEEEHDFYSDTWLGKHNNAVPMFMAHILLDQPYFRVSTIYNWRRNPIITRHEDGSVDVNDVIYTREGYPFMP